MDVPDPDSLRLSDSIGVPYDQVHFVMSGLAEMGMRHDRAEGTVRNAQSKGMLPFLVWAITKMKSR